MALLGGALALGLSAFKQNINLFFSPTQVHAGQALAHSTFRLGGIVVENSMHRGDADLSVTFAVTDTVSIVSVTYTGILPDLFREGQAVVVLGAMRDGQFIAQQVLAKHDETYMPPEVNDALKAAYQSRYLKAQ